MDGKEFKEAAARLQEISLIVSQLDESIRAEAFSILKAYISGPQTPHNARKPKDPEQHAARTRNVPTSMDDAESFFTAHPEGKPSDNVIFAAAYVYSQYGSEPFSIDHIEAIAASVGLTIPDRVDKTVLAARRKGKLLFHRVAQNQYKPTVHGEAFFKTTLNVQKGTKRRSAVE
jgi:hypothetical protein